MKDNDIAAILRELRKRRNLTQQQVGEAAGLSTSMICELESCKRTLSVKHVLDIAEAVGYYVTITFDERK